MGAGAIELVLTAGLGGTTQMAVPNVILCLLYCLVLQLICWLFSAAVNWKTSDATIVG